MKTFTRDDTEPDREYVLRADAEDEIRAAVAYERKRHAIEAGLIGCHVKPCAWMAQHEGQPVQTTCSQQQADAWAQAGGDVVELYDGVTFWNAIASTDARRRELQAQIAELQERLAHAGLEQQRAVRKERESIAQWLVGQGQPGYAHEVRFRA